MIQYFLEGVVAGFLAHQTRAWVDTLPRGYREWVSYVIGVCASYPTAARIYNASEHQSWARFAFAYFCGFAATGVGVGVGWVVDTVTERVSE